MSAVLRKTFRVPALLAATVALLAIGTSNAHAAGAPKIKHVFVVVLENENAAETFGADSPAPYLARTLASQGAYIPNYYATGHLSLDNYISMVSGQAPNIQTQADCPFYTDFIPILPLDHGQILGTGCVYPAGSVQTVANTLEDHGYTWKAYMEDMAAKAPAEPATCRHPGLNGQDNTQSAEVGDQYATRHNPFMYFHSIIDFPTCQQNDVDASRMAGDLQSQSTTANYSFIVPNLCHDGHDEPCVNGEPGGLVSANGWLAENVPKILASPAFNDHGLLIVTFDEAGASPPEGDASACCGENPGPNTPLPGIFGPGGGKTGAVLLSPCISGGTTDPAPYNHYSMLASVEDYFGLPRLGFSNDPGLDNFGSATFTRPGCDNYFARPAAPQHKKKKKKKKCKKAKAKRGKAKSAKKKCRKGRRHHRASPKHPPGRG